MAASMAMRKALAITASNGATSSITAFCQRRRIGKARAKITATMISCVTMELPLQGPAICTAPSGRRTTLPRTTAGWLQSSSKSWVIRAVSKLSFSMGIRAASPRTSTGRARISRTGPKEARRRSGAASKARARPASKGRSLEAPSRVVICWLRQSTATTKAAPATRPIGPGLGRQPAG